MKHNRTTYIDREIRQNDMTADHTSRLDKVLFFADPHFLFKDNIETTQSAHLGLPPRKANPYGTPKRASFQQAFY